MKILTKLFDFLLNPSKRTKHMLKPKRSDNIDYALEKKIKSLRTKNEIGTATTYQSVFIKFFIVTTIAFLMAFTIYFKLDSIESIFKFIKKYNLPDYGAQHSVDYQRTLVTDYLLLTLGISAILAYGSWAIGFYLYNPFLKFATFILSFFLGCFIGFFCAILKLLGSKGIASLISLIFTITSLTTIFIIIMISCLYYAKKILITAQVRNFTVKFCLFTYLFGLFIILFKLFAKDIHFVQNWELLLGVTLFLLFNLAQLIVGALMWVITLNNVDLFVAQKIPKKYEWILISVLFLALIQVFISIFNIILIIMRMLTLKQK